MSETNTPGPNNVVDAAERFISKQPEAGIPDNNSPADVIPFHDPAQKRAQERAKERADAFLGGMGKTASHFDQIDSYVSHPDQPARPDTYKVPESEPRHKQAAYRTSLRLAGLHSSPAKTEADADSEQTNTSFDASSSQNKRELPDKGRTQTFNRRNYRKHGTGPDQAS